MIDKSLQQIKVALSRHGFSIALRQNRQAALEFLGADYWLPIPTHCFRWNIQIVGFDDDPACIQPVVKGSKNHTKATPVLNAELSLLDSLLGQLLKRIGVLRIQHLVMDGFFGNYPTTWLAQQHGLHLISKLRSNAVLFFPHSDSKPRRGPTPR
jgi:hypothetical protein